MTYQEYYEFFPVADELVHYFEEMVDDGLEISATQLTKLISFGAQFSIGSEKFWHFLLETL